MCSHVRHVFLPLSFFPLTHAHTHTHTHTRTPTHTLTEEVEIVIAPADSAATANSTVLFTCVVYGLPLPSYVTWTFNNTLLYNSTSDNYTLTIYHSQFEVNGAVFLQSILEICGVVEEQAGNYSCSAESSAGNDTESFLLVVQPLGNDRMLHKLHDNCTSEVPIDP